MLTIIGCIGVTGGAAPLYSLRDRIYSSRVLFRIKLLAEQMAECAAQCATVTCAAQTRGDHIHSGPVPGLQKYYIITNRTYRIHRFAYTTAWESDKYFHSPQCFID